MIKGRNGDPLLPALEIVGSSGHPSWLWLISTGIRPLPSGRNIAVPRLEVSTFTTAADRACPDLSKRVSAPSASFGENLLQERSALGGGAGVDLHFFLFQNEEEAVQGFADDVFVEIELVGDLTAPGAVLLTW